MFALSNIWPGMSLGNHDDNFVQKDVKKFITLQPCKADTFVDHIPISNLGPVPKIDITTLGPVLNVFLVSFVYKKCNNIHF